MTIDFKPQNKSVDLKSSHFMLVEPVAAKAFFHQVTVYTSGSDVRYVGLICVLKIYLFWTTVPVDMCVFVCNMSITTS